MRRRRRLRDLPRRRYTSSFSKQILISREEGWDNPSTMKDTPPPDLSRLSLEDESSYSRETDFTTTTPLDDSHQYSNLNESLSTAVSSIHSPQRTPRRLGTASRSTPPVFPTRITYAQRTPGKAPRALLDEELTPSPSVKTLSTYVRTPMSPRRLLLCGIECCKGSTPDKNQEEIAIQNQIIRFLSAPDCTSWQLWTSQFFVHNVEKEEDVQRVFRKRAFDLAARRQRLESLKRDLDPFKNTKTPPPPSSIRRTRSFSVQVKDTPKYQPQLQQQRKANKPDQRRDKMPSVFECAPFNCAHSGKYAESVVHSTYENRLEADGYDSDPEDFTRQRNREHHRKTPTRSRPPPADSPSRPIHENDLSIPLQDFMNERLTLILHHDTRFADGGRRHLPRAVFAWLELGQQLARRVIMPKFAWKPVDGCADVTAIDILQIFRVLAVDKLDRHEHPFGRTDACLRIKTSQHSFLLEAASTSERNRIVLMLKLLISTFASKLATNDQFGVDPFFHWDHEFGGVPHWLK